MIHANELRIGNWAVNYGNYVYIEADDIVDCHHQPESYDPIPLTPEILGKAGFVLVDSLKTIIRFRCKRRIFYINKIGKEYYLNGYKYYPREIVFLHQFQNLYFAITGEELQIEF